MALVLTLQRGAIFNIGCRQFQVSSIERQDGCVLKELGAGKIAVSKSQKKSVGDGILLREGPRRESHKYTL